MGVREEERGTLRGQMGELRAALGALRKRIRREVLNLIAWCQEHKRRLVSIAVVAAGTYLLMQGLGEVYAPLRLLTAGAVLIAYGMFAIDVDRRP